MASSPVVEETGCLDSSSGEQGRGRASDPGADGDAGVLIGPSHGDSAQLGVGDASAGGPSCEMDVVGEDRSMEVADGEAVACEGTETGSENLGYEEAKNGADASSGGAEDVEHDRVAQGAEGSCVGGQKAEADEAETGSALGIAVEAAEAEEVEKIPDEEGVCELAKNKSFEKLESCAFEEIDAGGELADSNAQVVDELPGQSCLFLVNEADQREKVQMDAVETGSNIETAKVSGSVFVASIKVVETDHMDFEANIGGKIENVVEGGNGGELVDEKTSDATCSDLDNENLQGEVVGSTMSVMEDAHCELLDGNAHVVDDMSGQSDLVNENLQGEVVGSTVSVMEDAHCELLDGNAHVVDDMSGQSGLLLVNEVDQCEKVQMDVLGISAEVSDSILATSVKVVETDRINVEANIGGEMENVVEGRNGEELVEKYASCPEKGQSSASDATGCDLVDGKLHGEEIIDSTLSVMEDVSAASQTTTISLLDANCGAENEGTLAVAVAVAVAAASEENEVGCLSDASDLGLTQVEVAETCNLDEARMESEENKIMVNDIKDQVLIDELPQSEVNPFDQRGSEAERYCDDEPKADHVAIQCQIGSESPIPIATLDAENLDHTTDCSEVHFGAVEIRDRKQLTEEGISYAEKIQNNEKEAMSHILLCGHHDTADCFLESSIVDTGCQIKAAESVEVAALAALEAESLKGKPDTGIVQHDAVEGSQETEVNDYAISTAPEQKKKIVEDLGNLDSIDGHFQAIEAMFGSTHNEALIEESASGAEDLEGTFLLQVNQNKKSHTLEGEIKIGESSMLNCDEDKPCVLNTSAIDPSVNVHKADNAIFGKEIQLVNSVLGDAAVDSSNNVNKDSAPTGSALELNNTDKSPDCSEDMHLLNVDSLDSEHPLLAKVELAKRVFNVAETEDMNHGDKSMTNKEDGHGVLVLDVPVMESENIVSRFVEEHQSEKGGSAFCDSYSTVEAEPSAKCLADGSATQIVPEGMNLVVEIGMPSTSELSEFKNVVSQGMESAVTVSSDNQALECQATSSSINNHVADPSGSEQHMEKEAEEIEKDLSLNAETSHKAAIDAYLQTNQKNVTVGEPLYDFVVDGTNESNMLDREQELVKGSYGLAVKQVSMRSGASARENEQQACYFLPPKNKEGFFVSDLVWGKVKSHPWWPGQIFDPLNASDLALKYQKKDNFLIAYFGDKTFAWCDESQLKPFESCFSHMEKQSSSDVFVNAISGALDEVSRRTVLGMTCFCFPEEAKASIAEQKVENAGIRRGSTGCVIDKSLILNHFRPDMLLEYAKTLAHFPDGGADRLELVIAKAQLKAFYRSKGYQELPTFQIGGELVEYDAGEITGEDTIDLSTPNSTDLKPRKLKSRGRGDSNTPKHILEDGKKEKSLSDLMEVEDVSQFSNACKIECGGKHEGESFSVSSGKKHKVVESDSSDSGNNKKKKLDPFGDMEIKLPLPTIGSSFKVGECIRRVASQLTRSPPILKSHVGTTQKNLSKDDSVFDVFVSDASTSATMQTPRLEILNSEDYSSEELLSQLYLAASDPMEPCSFLPIVITFFTECRNFCVCASTEKRISEKVGSKRGRKRKVDIQSATADILTTDHMQDAYWSDLISRNNPTNGLRNKGEANMRNQRKKRKPPGKISSALTVVPVLQGAGHLQVGMLSPNMKLASRTDRSIIIVEEKMVNECTPTALVLNFNGSKPLPSETDLIRIFSRYGPLKEAATEVQKKKNRVKVVFKRRADAEIAFSSAGKYSIFGPSLLSYQLRYLPSIHDTSPDTKTEDKNDSVIDSSSNFVILAQADEEVGPDDVQAEVMTQESVECIGSDNVQAEVVTQESVECIGPDNVEVEVVTQESFECIGPDNVQAEVVTKELDSVTKLEEQNG